MNDSLNKALHYLTGTEDIDAVNADDLEKLVSDHPYFPIAHFLLTKKLKKQGSANFLPHVQKTALFFPNPYWLHYQLLNDLPEEAVIYDSEVLLSGNNQIIEDDGSSLDKDLATGDEINSTAQEDNKLANENPITTEFSPKEIQEASDLAHEILDENHATRNYNHNGIADVEDRFAPKGIEIRDESDAHDNNAEFAVDETPTPKDEQLEDHVTEPGGTAAMQAEDISLTKHATSQEPNLPAIQAEEETAVITRDIDETTEKFLREVTEEPSEESETGRREDGYPPEEKMSAEDDEHEKMFQNIKAMLDASAEEARGGAKSTIVPIDPYYTIDYFAAQGIKLDLERNPQDKLGKQVKKFTQWLKHMKKLGPEDALASESPSQAEVEAQQIADASNTTREVVTEAMALVLEKQGKKDKAIQLYRKLTFLNPHKSAYFADKINHLKGL